MKFHDNPFSHPLGVSYGQMNGQTDTAKLMDMLLQLIVLNMPEKVQTLYILYIS
jgi:hypothetical protein